jgi:hypothetical protein
VLEVQIFETVKAHLSARGMTMWQGTIVDVTLIVAPSSTKNKEGMRDPEMHQTKKGIQWYFGDVAAGPRSGKTISASTRGLRPDPFSRHHSRQRARPHPSG